MNIFIKLKRSSVSDESYLFYHCCFLFNKTPIGDCEQIVLAGALKLALDDLIFKLSSYQIIYSDEKDIEKNFNNYSMNNSCLPSYIECFDNDFGLFFCINDKEFLIVRRWDDMSLIRVRINLQDYLNNIIAISDKLAKSINKHSKNSLSSN